MLKYEKNVYFVISDSGGSKKNVSRVGAVCVGLVVVCVLLSAGNIGLILHSECSFYNIFILYIYMLDLCQKHSVEMSVSSTALGSILGQADWCEVCVEPPG